MSFPFASTWRFHVLMPLFSFSSADRGPDLLALSPDLSVVGIALLHSGRLAMKLAYVYCRSSRSNSPSFPEFSRV